MYTMPLLPYYFNPQLLYHQQSLRNINEIIWPQNNWYNGNEIDHGTVTMLPPIPPPIIDRHRLEQESTRKSHHERRKFHRSVGNYLDHRSESKNDSKETKHLSKNRSTHKNRENGLANGNDSIKRSRFNMATSGGMSRSSTVEPISKSSHKSKQLPPVVMPPSRSASELRERIQRERKAHTMPPLFHIAGPRSTPKARMFASVAAPSDTQHASIRMERESVNVLPSCPKSDVQMITTDIVDENDDDDAPIIITVRYDASADGPPSDDIVRKAIDKQLRQRENHGLNNEPIIVDLLDKSVQQQFSRPVIPTQQEALRMPSIRPQQQFHRPVLPMQQQQQVPRMPPVRFQQQLSRPSLTVQQHISGMPVTRPQQQLNRSPPFNPQLINRPSLRISVPPQRQQEQRLLPPTSSRPLRMVSSIQISSPPHGPQQNGTVHSTPPVLPPQQLPKNLTQQQQQQQDYFRSITTKQRLPNRDVKSLTLGRTFPTEFKTADNNFRAQNLFVPLKSNNPRRMATEQQLATVTDTTSGRTGHLQRPHTAPVSNEIYRPPSAQEIPELSHQSILSMLNQIPDLNGRKFNIEYAPPTALDGFPIPLQPNINDGQYPEPIVVDQLPPNLVQHLSKTNHPALAELMQSQVPALAPSQALPSTNVQAPPKVVMHHAAQPNQQVQQSRPVSSSATDTSTETSSSSEETDDEESEAKPSNNLPFTGPPHPPRSY